MVINVAMIAYVKKNRSERESLALGFEILVSCYVKIKHNLVIQHCQIKKNREGTRDCYVPFKVVVKTSII